MTNSLLIIVTGALLNSANLAICFLKKGRKLTQVDATLENMG